jgi:hypothetical protein
VTHVIPPFRLCRRRISVALGALCTAPLSAAPDRKPPYWQSLKADEVNMRVGPGEDYGIRFVYHRRHLPVKILRIKENWRFVEDPDGVRGWMVINFLGNERTATVRGAGLPKCARGAAIAGCCGRSLRAPWASWAIAGMAGASSISTAMSDMCGRIGFGVSGSRKG